ncbi:U-box domain-containing protein 29 [Dichanthelium oligosanthes]|uniref:U-box domain-containing protein n=1 Tax=Dichanthelium oligosanthes TaxID=888268 RepID=A0A1E5W3G1_9POAL|nr:U-box domain-containing protein 29 [Dichanthelium oligosanthes]
MGRREMSGRLSAEYQGLEVKVPGLFRCPISLDVMRSPVSLCTGVTYERASIQRWLDSGNTTCPATMLPLPSTDLVPNLTLRRLIALWASTAAPASPSSSSSPPAASAVGPTPAAAAAELLRRVAAPGADPCPPLRKLAAFLNDDDVDEFDKNALARAGGAAETVASVLRRAEKDDDAAGLEAAEAAVRVLAAIAASDCIEEESKRRVAAALAADAPSTATSLARVLRSGKTALEARVDAARLVESLLRNANAGVRTTVAESEPLVAELIRLVGPVDEKGGLDTSAVAAGLSCLAAIAATRRARAEMVRLGAVPAAVRVLSADAGCPEQALRVLEAAVGCADGRAAICESAETAVPAVVSRMMKGGMGGAEAAVSVLWAVCHRYRDRRAVAAAAACEGGLARLLLLMQSGCSAAARQMASELLKIFKVNGKSCLAGYDSKTSHIMPF